MKLRLLLLALLFWTTSLHDVLIPFVPNLFPRYAYKVIPKQEIRCLALNIYYEGRGEPHEGRIAIAMTTLNRLRYDIFPNTICKIVYQPGQFDWVEKKLKEPFAWFSALRLAKQVLANNRLDNFQDNTKGATSFHVTSIHPDWSHLEQTGIIGHQIFYRIKEPVAR